LTRSFYNSTDGSCDGEVTDKYELEFDKCLVSSLFSFYFIWGRNILLVGVGVCGMLLWFRRFFCSYLLCYYSNSLLDR